MQLPGHRSYPMYLLGTEHPHNKDIGNGDFEDESDSSKQAYRRARGL